MRWKYLCGGLWVRPITYSILDPGSNESSWQWMVTISSRAICSSFLTDVKERIFSKIVRNVTLKKGAFELLEKIRLNHRGIPARANFQEIVKSPDWPVIRGTASSIRVK